MWNTLGNYLKTKIKWLSFWWAMWPMGVLFYFITATNSLNKCNLRIDNLYIGFHYCIKSIDLIIGKEVKKFNLCLNSYNIDRILYINCSSWIAGKSHIYFNKLHVSNEAWRNQTDGLFFTYNVTIQNDI